MKIRNGFVSNSSSSSFLIIVRPSDTCPHCGRKDPDIIDLIDRSSSYNSDSTEMHFKGSAEEYIKYCEKEKQEDTWATERCNSHIKLIQDNLIEITDKDIVAYVSVSYHDDEINRLLKESKNVRILNEVD